MVVTQPEKHQSADVVKAETSNSLAGEAASGFYSRIVRLQDKRASFVSAGKEAPVEASLEEQKGPAE